jgi:hypothetical protein
MAYIETERERGRGTRYRGAERTHEVSAACEEREGRQEGRGGARKKGRVR